MYPESPLSSGYEDDQEEVMNPFNPELGSLPRSTGPQEQAATVSQTGTTTVGLTTTEGVVIATDMRASLGGGFVSNKTVQKVEQVHPTAALTMVGSVGGAQSFIRNLRAEVSLYEVRRGKDMRIPSLSTLAGNFARGGPFMAINPILGGVDSQRSTARDPSTANVEHQAHHVYTIDPAGGVMEDDYAATGSGMQLAYGVLEGEYHAELSNQEAVAIAVSAVESAMERDTGSGNGVVLAEITEGGVDIYEHHA